MNRTVLVVDDSATARTLVRLNLQKLEDVDLVFAINGREALVKVAELRPVVIVSDVNMPEMSGLELVAALRRDGVQTPVLLLTTRGEEPDIEQGLAAGATEYMTKPIDGARLVETVQRMLG